MIRELRILPPLAIARFGGAATPMDNYDAVVDPERPLGYRALRPAPTFRVDDATGAIAEEFVPAEVAFREDGRVRPVAPFFELWALTDDGELQPLTTQLLADEGAAAGDVRWHVEVANLKAARRTGNVNDRITAASGPFSDHDSHALSGTCEHFWPGKTIPLGHVRYIRPTPEHPEIRLRFTPAAGHVYGASRTAPPAGPPEDPNVVDVVYDGSRGGWLGHVAGGEAPPPTAPGLIFFGGADDPPSSRGYLDDGCDGIVRATLTLGGATLSAYARVGAGPPTYAPDALPIRTVADELEQALLGPAVAPGEATIEQAEEILRRAFETIRLMNTAQMNRRGMVDHDSDRNSTNRRREPIMAPALVDDSAVENLHQSLLTALRSGTAPWFADVLRRYDEVGDLTDRGRRKMPAMMRGADGRHLTLTRRQVDLFRALLHGPIFPRPTGAAGVNIAPTNLAAQLHHRAAGNLPSTLADSAVSNCFPGLEFDARNLWRRVLEGIEVHEARGLVVRGEGELARLEGRLLVQVGDQPTVVEIRGPRGDEEDAQLGFVFIEWSNALAGVMAAGAGQLVACEFLDFSTEPASSETVELRVRPLFARSDAGGAPIAVVDEDLVAPGELTQSLCSPWQNDYRECGCYYWAASRPDYVNRESGDDGVTTGINWMARDRERREYTPDSGDNPLQFGYEDLFRDWQSLLRFIVGGRDQD